MTSAIQLPDTTTEVGTTFLHGLLAIAPASGAVANFCDHLEHCEAARREDVLEAATTLRTTALDLAGALDLDLFDRYARRLLEVQRRSPLYPLDDFDVIATVATAESWNELQAVQARHDRLYHADVIGLHKQDQLRHCALHLAKLTGAAATVVSHPEMVDDFARRRLPDLVLFSLKLETLLGNRLAGELPRAGATSTAVAR